MSTSIDTMKNLFNVLQHYSYDENADGVAMLDDAVSSVTHFANLQHAINNFIADTTNTAIYPDTTDRLQATAGMVLGAENDFTADTGAITGKNAGGSTVKNAVTIVPESSTLDNVEIPEVGSTTTHTYTGEDGQTFTFNIKWPSSFTKFYDFRGIASQEALAALSKDERAARYVDAADFSSYTESDSENAITVTGDQMIYGMNVLIKGLYNYWVQEGFKLAYDSFGLDFNGKTIEIVFMGGGFSAAYQAMTGPEDNTTLPANEIQMYINVPMYSVIDSSDPNGNTRIEGGVSANYLDRTIAHELIHAVMQGKGLWKNNNPEFFTEGVAELVHGLDDYDGNNTARIYELATSYDALTAAMPIASGTGTAERYTSGYMFLRYLTQQSLNTNLQIGNNSSPVAFGYDGGENIILNYKTSDTVNYSTDYKGLEISGDDLILNSSTGKLYIRNARNSLINTVNADENMPDYFYMAGDAGEVSGFDKNSVLIGANDAANIITAGSSGDSLWGGNGNISDTLNGGAGADIFFYGYGNGNDIFGNANANDSINLFNVTMSQISSAEITDSGVNLQFSDGGSLTVGGQAGSFVLSSSGQTYHADYQNKVWTN